MYIDCHGGCGARIRPRMRTEKYCEACRAKRVPLNHAQKRWHAKRKTEDREIVHLITDADTIACRAEVSGVWATRETARVTCKRCGWYLARQEEAS